MRVKLAINPPLNYPLIVKCIVHAPPMLYLRLIVRSELCFEHSHQLPTYISLAQDFEGKYVHKQFSLVHD